MFHFFLLCIQRRLLDVLMGVLPALLRSQQRSCSLSVCCVVVVRTAVWVTSRSWCTVPHLIAQLFITILSGKTDRWVLGGTSCVVDGRK